jgi:hypothetical protein
MPPPPRFLGGNSNSCLALFDLYQFYSLIAAPICNFMMINARRSTLKSNFSAENNHQKCCGHKTKFYLKSCSTMETLVLRKKKDKSIEIMNMKLANFDVLQKLCLYGWFLEAIASLIVTFSLTHSVTQSHHLSKFLHMSATSQPHISHMLHVSHMSTTCQPHVSHMSATCQPHVSHMAATCQPHVSHMSAKCQPHVSHMSAICQPHLIHM